MTPEVLILRHGQTAWNLAGRYQGAMDSPLTTLGREHAAQQGRILREFLARSSGFECRSNRAHWLRRHWRWHRWG